MYLATVSKFETRIIYFDPYNGETEDERKKLNNGMKLTNWM